MLRGYVVILKRDGVSGNYCDWRADKCIFGSDSSCDVHIKLSSVAPFHCKLETMGDGRVFVENLSSSYRTLLNQVAIRDRTFVPDEGLLTIADRKFKFIYPECSPWKLKSQMSVQRSVAFSPISSNSPKKAVRASILPSVVHRSSKPSSVPSPRVRTPTLSSQRKGLSTTERYGPTPPRPSPRTPVINVERHSLKRRTSTASCSPISRNNVRKKARVNIICETPVLSGTQCIRRLPTPSTMSTSQTNNSSYYSLKSTVCDSPNITKQFDLPGESSATSSTIMTAESDASLGKPMTPARKPQNSRISCGVYDRNSGSHPAVRKEVQFGPRLSPEQFDSRLPPATPLKRGDLPPPGLVQRLRSSIVKKRSSVSESRLTSFARPVKRNPTASASSGLKTPAVSDRYLVDSFEGQSSVPSNVSLCGSSIDSRAGTLEANSTPSSRRSSLRRSRKFAPLDPVEIPKRRIGRPASTGSVYLSSRVGGRSHSLDPVMLRVVNSNKKVRGTSSSPATNRLSFPETGTSKTLFSEAALDDAQLDTSSTTAAGSIVRGSISRQSSIAWQHSQAVFETSGLIEPTQFAAATRRGPRALSDTPSPQLPTVRKLLKTPEPQISPLLAIDRHLVGATKTVSPQKSPRLAGVRQLLKTPKVLPSPRLSAIRKLVKSPEVQLSPRLSGIREMVRTPKSLPSPRLSGVRRLMKTPKVQPSPRLVGIREMLRTPKASRASPRLTGIRELVRTPRPSLPSPRLSGIRKLVKTPKQQASPILTGVRELMWSPKQVASPRLSGIRELMRSPKIRPSPRLSGIKELMDVSVDSAPDESETKPQVESPKPISRARKLKSGVSVAERSSRVVDIESSATKPRGRRVVGIKSTKSVAGPATRITRTRAAKVYSTVDEVGSPAVAATPAPKKRGARRVRFADSALAATPVLGRRGKRTLSPAAKSSSHMVVDSDASELVKSRSRLTKKIVCSSRKQIGYLEVEEPVSTEVPKAKSTRSRRAMVDKNLRAGIVEVMKDGGRVAATTAEPIVEEVTVSARKRARHASPVILASPKTVSIARGRRAETREQTGEMESVPVEENSTKRGARSRSIKGPIKNKEVVETPAAKRTRRGLTKAALSGAEAGSTVPATKSRARLTRANKQVQAESPISKPVRRGRSKK